MKTKDRHIIVGTIIFTLVALALMVMYNFTSFYQNMKENVELIGENSLAAEINQIETYLGQGSNTLKVSAMTVEYMLQHKDSPEDIEKYLKNQTQQFKEKIDENFTGVYGYIGGQYIDGSDWVPDADYIPTEREWYTAAVKGNGNVVLVSPYLDAMTNEVIVSVCCMLSDGESVLSIDIVLNKIQEITQSINLDNKGYGFIVDENGMVIAHNDINEIGKNYREGNPEMQTLLNNADSKNNFSMNIKDELNYVFTGTTSSNWKVAMIVSNEKLFQPVRNLLIRSIIIVVLVYVVVVLFCIFSLRRLEDSLAKLGKKEEEVEIANENLERSNNTISTIAYKNIITDFKNRYALQDDIANKYADHQLEVAYFDIVRFDEINDLYGYEMGDNLLYVISEKIKSAIDDHAEVYTVFGDTFCVIFDRKNSAVAGFQIDETIDKLYKIMTDTYVIQEVSIHVDVTVARCTCEPHENINFDKLINRMKMIIEDKRKA